MKDNPLKIPDQPLSPQASGLEALWRRGLDLVQQLSGDCWTDYNFHDPGVTILEQLCYALTESIYKSGFPVADYLTRADGKIDYQRQALYSPEQIFPCRPVTLDDYRKVLFDTALPIDNVFMVPESSEKIPGLYTIRVRLHISESAGDNNKCPQTIIEKIKVAYRQNRNLCEDLATVEIVTPPVCRLTGRIEIAGLRDPTDLLAEIYFRCARLIAPGIQVVSYDEAFKAGQNLETLFTGPLVSCGYIDPGSLANTPRAVTLTHIFSMIRSIEGVIDIHDLTLTDARNHPIGGLPDQQCAEAVILEIPSRQEQIGLVLVKKNRICPVSMTMLTASYRRMALTRRTYRHQPANFSVGPQNPLPRHRAFKTYTSVQNYFPKTYGIDRSGIPVSAGPGRKAQARQLKAYLLIFDQMLADFNAQLDHIKDLFSVDPDLYQSYFHQLLDDRSVPQIADLQAFSKDKMALAMQQKINRHDHFRDRRNRVLDYLLALYGEKFTQQYLRHLYHYLPPGKKAQAIIQNKINLLKHLPITSPHRGGAFDYSHMPWKNRRISGFELKVHILLALPRHYKQSLTAAIASHGLKLIADPKFRQMLEGGLSIPYIDLTDIKIQPDERFHRVPPDSAKDEPSPVMLEALARKTTLMQRQVVNAAFFRHGMRRESYRIGPLGDKGDFQVIFKPFDEEIWCHLSACADRKTAIQTANAFRRLLLHLNWASEGLHVIEHILLRPLCRPEHSGQSVSQAFYAFTITVLMPDWTARFHDTAFRHHAERTIRFNCPAHVTARIYWISYDQMHAFELVYRKWLEAKSSHPDGTPVLDGLSAQLINIILDLEKGKAEKNPAASHESTTDDAIIS